MEKEGIDAIEVSGGTHLSPEALSFSRKGIATEEKELYFKEAAALYKEKIKTPLMLVGGIRSLTVAEKAVEEGYFDKRLNPHVFREVLFGMAEQVIVAKMWENGGGGEEKGDD